jgi:hypothetical protein
MCPGLSTYALSRCTRHAIEDELHVLFECPAYQLIRLKDGSKWFSHFGDNLQSCHQGV